MSKVTNVAIGTTRTLNVPETSDGRKMNLWMNGKEISVNILPSRKETKVEVKVHKRNKSYSHTDAKKHKSCRKGQTV